MENVVHELMSETEDREVLQEVMYGFLKNSCFHKTTRILQFTTTRGFKLLIKKLCVYGTLYQQDVIK